ncbi:twin-arginine translocase TatA/TatE family subunit [Thermodesulfobacteriota bacterium]
MGWPGMTELLIILLIVVMLFGAKRIPEIMGGVGKGIKVFKKSVESDEPVVESTTSSAPDETAKKEEADSKPITPS